MNLIELMYHYRDFVRQNGKLAADLYLESCGANKQIRDELAICVDSKGNFVDFEGNLYTPEADELRREARETALDQPV